MTEDIRLERLCLYCYVKTVMWLHDTSVSGVLTEIFNQIMGYKLQRKPLILHDRSCDPENFTIYETQEQH